jgi:hypothetical protein
MLAVNLIDLGRTAESVTFYENAMRLAKINGDYVAFAAARRVYGRAKLAAGEIHYWSERNACCRRRNNRDENGTLTAANMRPKPVGVEGFVANDAGD